MFFCFFFLRQMFSSFIFACVFLEIRKLFLRQFFSKVFYIFLVFQAVYFTRLNRL